MPRLNKTFQNIAFFLYGRDGEGNLIGPVGSGGFVAVPIAAAWFLGHTYAVTCQHCLWAGGTIIRINTADGKSRLIETNPDQWQFIRGGSDIAAIDVTDLVRQRNGDEISVIPTEQFATKDFMREAEFGIGEDGFMLGLFSDQPGKDRNMVAARFGNVSLLADDRDPLEQPNGNRRPSHLFDMHSRPGSSGSPVFAYRTPGDDLRTIQLRGIDKRLDKDRVGQIARDAFTAAGLLDTNIDEVKADARRRLDEIRTREEREIENNTFLVLFGIHVGQYHDRVTAKKVKKESPRAESNDMIREGDELEFPNSVALVAPAWDVYDLLMIDKFVQQRKAREEMDAERDKP